MPRWEAHTAPEGEASRVHSGVGVDCTLRRHVPAPPGVVDVRSGPTTWAHSELGCFREGGLMAIASSDPAPSPRPQPEALLVARPARRASIRTTGATAAAL